MAFELLKLHFMTKILFPNGQFTESDHGLSDIDLKSTLSKVPNGVIVIL